jgi:hypothetical protein
MTTRTDYTGKADTSAKTDSPTDTTTESGRTAAIGGAVSDAAGTVKDVAADAAARLPEVAATTRTALEDANRQMRTGSDEMLSMGSALSFGLAGGLLIGGAPRLLVAAAFLPAVAMVLTLLDRSSRTRGQTGRSLQGR